MHIVNVVRLVVQSTSLINTDFEGKVENEKKKKDKEMYLVLVL
jgi:hypothetical protein